MAHSYKVLDDFKRSEVCVFCKRNTNDELNFGKIYKYCDIQLHYFCLLFASHLLQNGHDNEGILGFLLGDVRGELKRNSTIECFFCKETGASCSCGSKRCGINFHFPCGRENNTCHHFFGKFRSFCPNHHPKSSILPADVDIKDVICVICQERIENTSKTDIVFTLCCKNTCFHRICIQKMALSAGYFFKCPNCNDRKKFRHSILRNGIYIPDQDAAWELLPDNFNDLYEQYSSCDAPRCLCSFGRTYFSSGGCWKIVRCNTCGSQGTHKKCAKNTLMSNGEWTCQSCFEIGSSLAGNKENIEVDASRSGCTSTQKTESGVKMKKKVKMTRNRFTGSKKRKYESKKVGRPSKTVANSKSEKRIRYYVDGSPVSILPSCKVQLKKLRVVLSASKI